MAPAAAAISDAGPDPGLALDLPFSIEPGMALELGGSFYVTALRHEPRGSRALLARLGRAPGAAPAVLELAQLDGDVPPPRLAADGDELLVAVEDTEAGALRVRVARLPAALLAGSQPAPQLEWRAGPEPARDESNVYDFAAGQGLTLFAWDDWPQGQSHGRVFVLSLARDGSASAPEALSGVDVDAEEPRLVPRPGGYWLSWLVATTAAARERVYDPGERDPSSPQPGGGGGEPGEAEGAGGARLPLTGGTPYGARGIEILALDPAGKPAGNVRRIRTGAARVVGYDLTTSADGSAWLVWRQDAPSPSAAGGRVFLVEVRSDGPGEPLLVREEDVGSGAPSWLSGEALVAAAPGIARRWLTFPDQRDRTLLLPIELPLSPPEPLPLGASLQGAAALTAAAGQLLFALPRGRALELFTAACR